MRRFGLRRWDPFAPGLWESPFGLLRRLTTDMDRALEGFPAGRFGRAAAEERWLPNIDVLEKEGTLLIRADLPGLTKEDVTIDVTEDTLTLRGERKKEFEEEREGVYRIERAYGAFFRTVPLPEGVKPEDVKARFVNGVLEIAVPLPAEQKEPRPRRVPIEEQAGKAARPEQPVPVG